MQTEVLARLDLVAVRPDLMVTIVVIWSLLVGGIEAMVMAFLGGVLLDLLAGNPLGSSALGLIAVAGLSSPWRLGLRRTNPMLHLVTVFVGTVAYYTVIVVVIDSLQARVDVRDAWLAVAIPSGLLNLVLTIPLLELLRRLDVRLRGPIIQVA